MIKTPKKRYRKGVGIMLVNEYNMIWVGRRIDLTSQCWQMPQGGIDDGESPEAAALRELYEETGAHAGLVEILAISKGWYHYEIPPELKATVWKGRYDGQKQRWYVMRYLGQDRHINLTVSKPEFSEWRWSTSADLVKFAVRFKVPLYESLINEFSSFL